MAHVAAAALLILQAIPQTPARTAEMEKYFNEALRAWQVPGAAIAVVRHDSVVVARGFGVRSLKEGGRVTAATVFGIGSLTKAFTTTALAMLSDAGVIRWDDPVIRYLPTFRLPDGAGRSEATLRDLAAHRTGLAGSDFVWYAGGHDRAELVRRARFLREAAGFRERLAYSNLMYIALGEVIGTAGGIRWDELVARRIFTPLGMTRTSTSIHSLPTEDVATPHARIDGQVVPIPRRHVDNLGAAGAINSTAADLAEWLRLQLRRGAAPGGRLVSERGLGETWTAWMSLPGESPGDGMGESRDSHLEGYGLGWYLRDYRGRLVVEHGGNIDGMSAAIAMVPELGIGVVVLTNLHGSPAPDLLARWALDRELAAPVTDWSGEALARRKSRPASKNDQAGRIAGTRPSLPLDRYAGTYRDSLYGALTVERRGDGLIARLGTGLEGPLEHWHQDVFRARWTPAMWGGAFISFRIDPRGEIGGLEIDLGGEPRPVWFGRSAEAIAAEPSRDELILAMSAKIVCSGVFLTGREPEEILRNSAARFFGSFRREQIREVAVDRRERSVRLTLADGISRTARFTGDQGCVTLPRGDSVLHFTPVPVRTSLPPAATMPWPMGDAPAPGPAAAGVDRKRLERALDVAFTPPEALTLAMVVVHRGRIVAERYAPGIGPDTQLESWSMGKSITGTLIGLLIQQGHLSLDQPVPLAEWQRPGDARAAIRISDLMRMSSGLRFSGSEDPPSTWRLAHPDHLYVYSGAIDIFDFSINQPLEHPPNTVGRYRNSDALALGAVIEQTVTGLGEEYLTWPQKALFDRIGIRRQVLETDPWGNFLMTGYDYGTARNWARLGMLWLQDGMWMGQRLLPEGFSRFASTPAPAWKRPEYGALFRLNGTGAWKVPVDAYFMSGGGVSKTMIVPSHDLVIVRMGHLQGIGRYEDTLNAAYAEIVAAVEPRS